MMMIMIMIIMMMRLMMVMYCSTYRMKNTNTTHVPQHTYRIRKNRGIVFVFYTMTLAALLNDLTNSRIMPRIHSGKEMMLNLHVQTTTHNHGCNTTVSTARLRLRFVPIDLDVILLVLRGDSSRISIATLKVVTDHKEKCQIDTTNKVDKK